VPDIDPETLKAAQEIVDTERRRQSELNLQRRQQAIQIEAISSTEALKQDVRQLVYETHQLLEYLQKSALQDDALQDYFENLSHRIERLESGMMLVLMDKLDSPQVKREAKTIIKGIDREHRKRLLSQHTKNLAILEERAAMYGLNVPLELRNEIDAEREAIAGYD